MDEKLRETTNLCVEMMNSKRQVLKGETWSRGTYSRLPLDVNVILNISTIYCFFDSIFSETFAQR